ncbi:MAG: hypothetical protein KBA66_10625 [Leptospiraceae bacterium]|nr:hypothetical protein [Leptospiraceae bacterium]
MKKIFLLCLLLSTLDCTHYFVRDSSQYELTSDELEFLRSKKIGLIGFYPFATKTKQVWAHDILNMNLEIKNPRYLRIIEFVNDNPKEKVFVDVKEDNFISFSQYKSTIYQTSITLYENDNLIKILDFGKSSKQLKIVEKDTLISSENLREFLSIYLRNTRNLGLPEVDNLLIIPEQKEEPIKMKKFDVDYWVIGLFHTNFENTENNKKGFTLLPFLMTLGTFPFWDEEKVVSTFIVLDNKLNQIKMIETNSIHDSIKAWWAPVLSFGEVYTDPVLISPSAKFYKPNVKQFSKELVQVLKK